MNTSDEVKAIYQSAREFKVPIIDREEPKRSDYDSNDEFRIARNTYKKALKYRLKGFLVIDGNYISDLTKTRFKRKIKSIRNNAKRTKGRLWNYIPTEGNPITKIRRLTFKYQSTEYKDAEYKRWNGEDLTVNIMVKEKHYIRNANKWITGIEITERLVECGKHIPAKLKRIRDISPYEAEINRLINLKKK